MSRSRAGLLGLVALVMICAIVGTTLALNRHGGSATHSTPASRRTPTPRPAAQALKVRWVQLAGVSLPVSSTDGPRDLSHGLARGFSDTPDGAALAAVHLVVRTSPSVSPAIVNTTMQQQVVGPNQPALLRSVSDARSAHAPAATASVAGYVPVYFDPSHSASVDLVIGSPELALRRQYLSVRVSLQWSDDDWRLVAPPQGEWANVTSTIDALPVSMHRYGG